MRGCIPASERVKKGPRSDYYRRRPRVVFDLPPEVEQFLVAQGYKKKLGAYAQNTLVPRLAVLSKAHQSVNADNPCNRTQVRELIKNVRSGNAKRGVKPYKQAALTMKRLAKDTVTPFGQSKPSIFLGRARPESLPARAPHSGWRRHGQRPPCQFAGNYPLSRVANAQLRLHGATATPAAST